MKHESAHARFLIACFRQRSTNGSMSTTNLVKMMSMLGLNHLGAEMSRESAKIVYHTFVKADSIWEAVPRLCSEFPPDKGVNQTPTPPKTINKTMGSTAPPFRICFSTNTIKRSAALTSSPASAMFARDNTAKKRRARRHVDTRERKQRRTHNMCVLKK